MIVAKTRLQKMPQSCRKCSLSTVDSWTGDRVCNIKHRLCPLEVRNGHVSYAKPEWCPLVEVAQ